MGLDEVVQHFLLVTWGLFFALHLSGVSDRVLGDVLATPLDHEIEAAVFGHLHVADDADKRLDDVQH